MCENRIRVLPKHLSTQRRLYNQQCRFGEFCFFFCFFICLFLPIKQFVCWPATSINQMARRTSFLAWFRYGLRFWLDHYCWNRIALGMQIVCWLMTGFWFWGVAIISIAGQCLIDSVVGHVN